MYLTGMCLTLESVGVPQITLYGPPEIVSSLLDLDIATYSGP